MLFNCYVVEEDFIPRVEYKTEYLDEDKLFGQTPSFISKYLSEFEQKFGKGTVEQRWSGYEDNYFVYQYKGVEDDDALNIRNGLSFARKVMVTGGADVLILDEVLGLVDLGILPQDELRQLLAVRPEEMQLIITGKVFPEELKDCVDLVSRIETIYCKN